MISTRLSQELITSLLKNTLCSPNSCTCPFALKPMTAHTTLKIFFVELPTHISHLPARMDLFYKNVYFKMYFFLEMP